ncbi:acyltransferase [bacterium]|nr:acyltransferase [bacterium]
MQKIKNIELLRVIGCVAILFLHLFHKTLCNYFPDIHFYQHMYNATSNGQKAVDLFFMLSGLFFAWKLNTKYGIWDFVKKKIIRLWPVLIFLLLLTTVASLFGIYKFNMYDKILALVGLNGTGWIMVKGVSNAGVFWYVSSMFWVLLLFYYLRKYFNKKNVDLFISIVVYFSYAFLIHAKGGKINSADQNFYYIFNVGILRALGGIGIGYFIGDWYRNNEEKIRAWSVTVLQKIALTVLEFMCLFFIINNLMLRRLKYGNDMIYIVTFVVIIVLFLLNKGYISRLLNDTKIGDVSVFCAKYTYSIYMMQFFVFNIINAFVWKRFPDFVLSHQIINVEFTLLCVIIFGIFTYHFVEKPCVDYFKYKKNQ